MTWSTNSSSGRRSSGSAIRSMRRRTWVPSHPPAKRRKSWSTSTSGPRSSCRSAGRRRPGPRTPERPGRRRWRSSPTGRPSTSTTPGGSRRRRSTRKSSPAAGDRRSRLGGSRPSRPQQDALQLDLVSHDSVVLPEAVLLVHRAGGGVDVLRDDVHHPKAVVASLPDCRSDEPRPESLAVIVGVDVKLMELRPPLHSRIEPGGLERGTPEHESGDTAIGDRDGHPAAAELHRIVHKEVRVDAADTRGVVKPEGPKSRPGGLPTRHVACIPPPLPDAWVIGLKDLVACPACGPLRGSAQVRRCGTRSPGPPYTLGRSIDRRTPRGRGSALRDVPAAPSTFGGPLRSRNGRGRSPLRPRRCKP